VIWSELLFSRLTRRVGCATVVEAIAELSFQLILSPVNKGIVSVSGRGPK